MRWLCLLVSLGTLCAQTAVDGLRWRLIGPFRGGRSVAACGVPGDPYTFYFGAVGGGLWKTTNGGWTWSPIFDDQTAASIGAVEVAPSNPNILYVGTGEADIRSNLSQGDGVYKSTDAGKTWHNIGLRDTRQIGRIAIHPKNPDIVYVAALGHAYGPNDERGVFRTTDGGRTWKRVLDKGPDVGATDLSLDPDNPDVIYATTWQARRPPWSVYGPLEGPGGGLYKSTDAGDHWTQLSGNGLPGGEWHRAAVAVARGTRGQRVYAVIDTTAGNGLFRSDNAGRSWTRTSNDTRIDSRSWYFSSVTVDPKNPDVVYLPNVSVYRSTDGGKTFTVLKGAPGGDDYHYLWVDPTEPARMILAADQGTVISVDRGATWGSWYNQPTAQLYHVSTDNQFPYHVYASQQDSGTAVVPSRTNHGQISEYDRYSVGGAEAGYIQPDPKDSNIVYVSDTYGSLTRFDKRTGQGHDITPWPLQSFGDISQKKYRFTWTAPLVFSPVDHALYYGSQFVLKTIDGGLSWHEISPDLTGADKNTATPGSSVTVEDAKVRGYGAVYSIGPSPLAPQELWAGSDTGLIHLTRDGGKTWSNVTPKGLSDWSKITAIEPSRYDPATAYAAVDRHRLDDNKPYLYRTRDYGHTWTEITSGIHPSAFLNAIREDPVRRGLLFAATERGVYVSYDDGDHWLPLQLNLPPASVRDLVIHQDDLVIATHGRSFWILDDIAPLRQYDSKVALSDAFLYKPSTAIRMNSEGFQGTPLPPEVPKADNPPDGAIIDYYLKSAAAEATIEILDAKNQVVRRYASSDKPRAGGRPQAIADIWIHPPQAVGTRAGMNRFVWDLRAVLSEGFETDFGPAPRGPQVLPGTYQVRLTVAGKQYTQPLKVILDPRSPATPGELARQFDTGMKISQALARASQLTRQITALRQHLGELRQKEPTKALLTTLISSVDADAAEIAGGGGRRRNAAAPPSGIVEVRSSLNSLSGVVESADRTPPAQAMVAFEQASKNLAAQTAAWNTLKSGKLAELNKTLQAQNLPEIELSENK